ncbi:MAG: DUF6788 family protein [Acidimicrobiales bacterium]
MGGGGRCRAGSNATRTSTGHLPPSPPGSVSSCPGSLVSRTTASGKSGCRCQDDPPEHHGPYYQWSRALDGKTISRRLSAEQAVLYREWIENRRRLARIVAQMNEVSAAAGEILLRQAGARSQPATR